LPLPLCHGTTDASQQTKSPYVMNDAAPEPRIATGTLMQGKRGVIMGVANDRSIAWGIARAIAAQGGEIAFTYQGEALEKRVKPLAESIGSTMLLPCDVADDASMDAAFGAIGKAWGKIDFLVHAIGYADKQFLRGRYLDTPRAAFLQAMDISCFSFVAVGQRAAALMSEGASMLTLSYLGAERVTPHYNVMGVAKAALEASVRYMATDLGERGIRVNAISAGPIKTLAASGIGDFRYILRWNQYNSPLRRNVTIEEVGGSGLYLLSDLAAGVTGEVHHVDSGYHIVGMKNPDAPDITVEKG
jgi:enoyl-[acyl-carrier protein] reductase I